VVTRQTWISMDANVDRVRLTALLDRLLSLVGFDQAAKQNKKLFKAPAKLARHTICKGRE
jgi:hypothetical protein